MRRTPLRRRSSKTSVRDRRYTRERRAFLDARPICEAGLEGCGIRASEVHHMAGRGARVFFDQGLWLPVCNGCHGWITCHPAESYERGLSVRRSGG